MMPPRVLASGPKPCGGNKERNYYSFFSSKSFSVTRKPAFSHFGKHEKKPFYAICCLYKMRQSQWLLCVARNCHWSRKITPFSNLTQMASCGMKTCSDRTAKSSNGKENAGKSSQFFHQSSLVSRKA